jgi:hypothetical protein
VVRGRGSLRGLQQDAVVDSLAAEALLGVGGSLLQDVIAPTLAPSEDEALAVTHRGAEALG